MAVARIKAGQQQKLELGNLEAKRDWGFAPDYVRAMHAILNHEKADDFVVATGVLHSVGELCVVAFSYAGLDWRKHVEVNSMFNRLENEVPLVGCADKILQKTHWHPSTSFETMVRQMVEADLRRLG
jgi:GDPmannose 4,6-dehydratase